MDEWAKVVIYPLGFCGFALFLLWRVYNSAKPAPLLKALAGVAFFAGLALAFLEFTNTGARADYAERAAPAAEERKPPHAVNLASLTPDVRPAQTVLPPPAAPPQTQVLELSGAWQEPDGNAATVTQSGRSLRIKVLWVDVVARMFGVDGGALDYAGSLADCPDGQHAAHAELSTTAGARLALLVMPDGRRMEGVLNAGFGPVPVALLRR